MVQEHHRTQGADRGGGAAADLREGNAQVSFQQKAESIDFLPLRKIPPASQD
jgi:hypothetical protein